MLFGELYLIPPLDLPSTRCIQYPVSLFARSFFDASTLTLKCFQDTSSQFSNIPLHALAQYHYAHTCIVLCGLHHPIEFECVVTYIVLTVSEILQLLLSPVAVYSPFWRRSPSTFFLYPTSCFRASSSPKKTAHLHSLRHVIMSLGPLYWAAFPASGLSRLHGTTSPSALSSGKNRHVNFSPHGSTSITPRSLGRLQYR